MSGWTTEVDAAVGARLKAARDARGWTLSRLAAECGKGENELSMYERGARAMTVTSLWQVARGLGRPVGWFFKDIEAPGWAPPRPPRPALKAKRLALGMASAQAIRRRRGRP